MKSRLQLLFQAPIIRFSLLFRKLRNCHGNDTNWVSPQHNTFTLPNSNNLLPLLQASRGPGFWRVLVPLLLNLVQSRVCGFFVSVGERPHLGRLRTLQRELYVDFDALGLRRAREREREREIERLPIFLRSKNVFSNSAASAIPICKI
jgi:hypothetical protein